MDIYTGREGSNWRKKENYEKTLAFFTMYYCKSIRGQLPNVSSHYHHNPFLFAHFPPINCCLLLVAGVAIAVWRTFLLSVALNLRGQAGSPRRQEGLSKDGLQNLPHESGHAHLRYRSRTLWARNTACISHWRSYKACRHTSHASLVGLTNTHATFVPLVDRESAWCTQRCGKNVA